MTYRQSGIIYRQPNFAYNKSDATVSVATIAATANLVLTARYTYRPSERPGYVDYRWHKPYNNPGFVYNERDNTAPDNRLLKIYNQPNVSYRQAKSVGISFKVVGFPGSIPIATTVGGTGSIPVTIVANVIGCTSEVAGASGPLIINLDMDFIKILGHVITKVVIDNATIISRLVDSSIGISASLPTITLYITTTIIVPDSEAIGVQANIYTPTVRANYTATPKMSLVAALGAIPIHRMIEVPITNSVPTIGPRGYAPAANALRRYYVPGPRQGNVFIINNATVQIDYPVDTTTITRSIYGAHNSPLDLTETEYLLLVAAGYDFRIGPEMSTV